MIMAYWNYIIMILQKIRSFFQLYNNKNIYNINDFKNFSIK